jgi:hypothetical protein
MSLTSFTILMQYNNTVDEVQYLMQCESQSGGCSAGFFLRGYLVDIVYMGMDDITH